MELERELMADSTSDSESEATTSGRIAYTPKRTRGGKASGSGSSSRSSLSIKHGKGGGRNSYSARGRPRGSAVAGTEVDRAVEAVSQEVRTLIPQVQALRQKYNQLLMQRSSSTSTQQLPGTSAAAAPTHPAATAATGPSCSSPRVPMASSPDIIPVTVAALPASAVPDSYRVLKAEMCVAPDTAAAACAPASCLLPTPSQPVVPRLATLGRPIPSAIIQDITAAAAVAAAAAAAADNHGIPEPDEDMADLADEELLLDPRHSLAVPPEYCQAEHHALLRGRASPSIAPGAPGCTLLTPRGAERSCGDPEDGMDAEEAAELFAGLDSPKDLLLARLTPRQLLPHTMLPHHLPESTQAIMYLPPWKGAPCGPRGAGAGASEAACNSAHVKKEDLGAGCCTSASRALPPGGGLLEYQCSANSTLHSSLSTTLHMRRASSTADSDGDEEHMLHHPHTPGLPRSCLGQGDALPFHSLPHPAWDEAGMYCEEPGMALGLPLHGWEHCGQYVDPYSFARPLGGSAGEPDSNMYEYAYIDVTLVDPDEV